MYISSIRKKDSIWFGWGISLTILGLYIAMEFSSYYGSLLEWTIGMIIAVSGFLSFVLGFIAYKFNEEDQKNTMISIVSTFSFVVFTILLPLFKGFGGFLWMKTERFDKLFDNVTMNFYWDHITISQSFNLTVYKNTSSL